MTHHPASTSVSDLCAKMKNMGYAASKRVKLYGEEYEIVSDPFLEDEVVVVEAKTTKDPVIRMVRLPSTVLPSVRGRKPKNAA